MNSWNAEGIRFLGRDPDALQLFSLRVSDSTKLFWGDKLMNQPTIWTPHETQMTFPFVIAYLNRSWLRPKPTARRSFEKNLPDVSRLRFLVLHLSSDALFEAILWTIAHRK